VAKGYKIIACIHTITIVRTCTNTALRPASRTRRHKEDMISLPLYLYYCYETPNTPPPPQTAAGPQRLTRASGRVHRSHTGCMPPLRAHALPHTHTHEVLKFSCYTPPPPPPPPGSGSPTPAPHLVPRGSAPPRG